MHALNQATVVQILNIKLPVMVRGIAVPTIYHKHAILHPGRGVRQHHGVVPVRNQERHVQGRKADPIHNVMA